MATTWDTARAVTVRQLLALGALNNALLLGGEAGIDEKVSDVVVSGRFMVNDFEPGAAVLLDGSVLQSDTYQIDILLRDISLRHARALFVVRPAAEIGLATARLANKLRIPLISVPQADVIVVIDELRASVLTPQLQFSQTMFAALDSLERNTESAGINGLISSLEKLLAADISLVGIEGFVVSGAPLENPLATRDRIPVAWSRTTNNVTWVQHPVSLAPKERPTFWLLARRTNATEAWAAAAALALQTAAWAAGTRLVTDRLAMERDARFRLGALSGIISSTDNTDPALAQQIGMLGWNVDGWCSAIEIVLSDETDHLRVLALTDDLVRCLAAVKVRMNPVERADGWTFWLVSQQEPATHSYREVVSALRDSMELFSLSHGHLRLHVGVGRPYLGLAGLRTSLTEAREAVTIAVAEGGNLAVQHIDELGVRRLLFGWYASETFNAFALELLEPLRRADPRGELLQTIETYLDAESSATHTAEILGLHRNTVLKRLTRARQLLAVDLDEPDERLALQLACRVGRLGSVERA